MTEPAPAVRSLRGRSGPPAPPPRQRLPLRLRLARIGELASFGVLGVVLLSLPVPRASHPGEIAAAAIIAAECVASVAVAVGLGRRRRWAAVAGLLLAAWLIGNTVVRMPPLVSRGGFGGTFPLLAFAFAAWVLLMQLIVVALLASPKLWRTELH